MRIAGSCAALLTHSVRVAPVGQRLPYCSKHHLAAAVGKFDSDNQLPTAAAAAGARRAPRERKQQRGGVKETAAPKAASTAATATDAEAPGQELRPAVRHCCPTCPLSDQQPQWRGSAHSQVPRARVPHAKPRARAQAMRGPFEHSSIFGSQSS